MNRTGWIVLVACLVLPATTFAADEVRYCAELIKLYRTYVNNPEDPRPTYASPNVAHEEAIASCKAGRTAAGIPTLEKVLQDNKVTLPDRS
ncbi:MAG TPA: hypothetical protein VMI56_06225 [Reyranella sp.]|nr:hypothetical protein [Reyranella sp.]